MDKVQNLIDEKKSKCDNNDKSKHIGYVQFLENKIKTKYGRKEKVTTLIYIYIYICKIQGNNNNNNNNKAKK